MQSYLKFIVGMLLILLLFPNCNSKKSSQDVGFHCGSWVLREKDWIDSEIKVFEILKNEGSNQIFVHGKINGVLINNDSLIYEPIPFATIALKLSGDSIYSIGDISDINGGFNIPIDEGDYELKISYIGFSSITINNLILKQGDKLKLNVDLGEGGIKYIYRVDLYNELVKEK